MRRAWLCMAALLLAQLTGCAKRERVVVVYSSQDQLYAEPIFKDFTDKTGIAVKPVFDTESVKTAGLVNRLFFERNNPQCDIFWSNEQMHAAILEQAGTLAPGSVTNIGYRSRRLVINTNLVKIEQAPKSLLELTNSAWMGKVAIAFPLYGTTASHFFALRDLWSEPVWRAWCEGLRANKTRLVDGNSIVAQLVARGEVSLGLTDSDDIEAARKDGAPLAALPLSKEMLVIPNSVGITRDAPHIDEAEALRQYLSSSQALDKLIAAKALEGATASSITNAYLTLTNLTPARLNEMKEYLAGVFLREK